MILFVFFHKHTTMRSRGAYTTIQNRSGTTHSGRDIYRIWFSANNWNQPEIINHPLPTSIQKHKLTYSLLPQQQENITIINLQTPFLAYRYNQTHTQIHTTSSSITNNPYTGSHKTHNTYTGSHKTHNPYTNPQT